MSQLNRLHWLFFCGENEDADTVSSCTKSVIWDSDFDFEDMGYEGEGIVHICHCTNCGAEIEYRIRTDNDEG